MPSSKSKATKPATSRGSRASGPGELESEDLDKVTGGMKPIGGSYAGKTPSFTGDPCDGGE